MTLRESPAQMTLKDLYRNSVSLNQSGHDFARDAYNYFEIMKLSTAYHEAGHAIALHHHGCRVGVTYCVGVRFWNWSHIWAQSRVLRAQIAKLSRDARIECYFAGAAAQVLAFSLLNNDLKTSEAEILRRHVAIGAQSDILKAIPLYLNSDSERDTCDFAADERNFLNFFEHQTSRAMGLLTPRREMMHSFAERLAKRQIVMNSSKCLDSMIV
jgi:hypothetical protein